MTRGTVIKGYGPAEGMVGDIGFEMDSMHMKRRLSLVARMGLTALVLQDYSMVGVSGE